MKYLVPILVVAVVGCAASAGSDGSGELPDLPMPGNEADGASAGAAGMGGSAMREPGKVSLRGHEPGGQAGMGGGMDAEPQPPQAGTGGQAAPIPGDAGGQVDPGAGGAGGQTSDNTGGSGGDTAGSGGTGGSGGDPAGTGGIPDGSGGSQPDPSTGGTVAPACAPDAFEPNDTIGMATQDSMLPAGDGSSDSIGADVTFDRADDQDWLSFGTVNSVVGAAAHNPTPVHLHWQATSAKVIGLRIYCSNKLSSCTGGTILSGFGAPCLASSPAASGDVTFLCGDTHFSVQVALARDDAGDCDGAIDLSYEPAQ